METPVLYSALYSQINISFYYIYYMLLYLLLFKHESIETPVLYLHGIHTKNSHFRLDNLMAKLFFLKM